MKKQQQKTNKQTNKISKSEDTTSNLDFHKLYLPYDQYFYTRLIRIFEKINKISQLLSSEEKFALNCN